jgi:hypothetical protein
MDNFLQQFGAAYDIVADTNPTSYLGMKLDRQPNNGNITLSLPNYSQRMVDQFNTDHGLKMASTPAITSNPNNNTTPQPLGKDQQQLYMQMVGSLLYLGICTRPDILGAVHPLTQKMHQATTADLTAARRVIRYVMNTINIGITFYSRGDTTIYAWADAAFGTTYDRKSQHGLCYSLGKFTGCFYSTVKKQSIVALSSTEAEYIAAAEGVREILWLRMFMTHLGYPQPPSTTLYQDNESTISIAHTEEISDRNKHVDIKYHFLKDYVIKGTIFLAHLPTEEMTADILTKPLAEDSFIYLRSKLLGYDDSGN